MAKMYTYALSPAFHSIGTNTTIIPPLRFSSLSSMQIGSQVTIHKSCWIQVLRSDGGDDTPKLIIGNNVGIGMNSTISVARKVVIEEFVFTARNVYISDHGHEYRDTRKPIAVQGIADIREVVIGARTWLGQNVVVLPGVKIGKHCVIGANSVVNKDIPDFSIAAGVPARVIRRYDHEKQSWDRV
jgi:acetyltransferase-like isoleucine patch superfamily enzyme